MEPKDEVAPHYHTACRNCGVAIIMGKSVYPPNRWMPFDLTGKGHDCPNRPHLEVVGPEAVSRNQALNSE